MLRSGNRVTLLENGAEYFPALLAAIDAAQRDIHLETYLFAADPAGAAVAEALARAAQRGVRVRVILDGFGCRALAPSLQHQWAKTGVEWLYFRPLRRRLFSLGAAEFALRRPRLRRNHRKLVVIDAQVAFVGGINIIDDHNAPGWPDHRYDYAVRIEGPVLADIYPAACRLWRLTRWHQLGRGARPAKAARVPIDMTPHGDQMAQFVLRDNLGHRREIEDAYLAAIRSAHREIVIANAYFLPGYQLRRALVDAAGRGVRVVLLLQGRADHPFARWASRALYGHFLDHGIEIREYHASYLHAKVAVIDSHWATVGSSNIDPFSLWLSREANVVVYDAAFAAQLRMRLEVAMRRGSHAIHRMQWRRVGRWRRALAWLAYVGVRWLVALTGPNLG